VLHFEPAYHHARHYIGWAVDIDARLAEHIAGAGSPGRTSSLTGENRAVERKLGPPG
jgi:hypothetical protein